MAHPTAYQADGFVIRAYRAGDGAALTEAADASYEHLRPWMPWAQVHQPVSDSEDLCTRFATEYEASRDFVLGIWEGETLIGGTGFHLRCGPIEWKIAEVGMWIRGDHAGQGWGKRSLAAMLDWGFADRGWERLVWKCDTRNRASSRVAEANGLTLEASHRQDAVDHFGFRRDTHVYAILKSERLGSKSEPDFRH